MRNEEWGIRSGEWKMRNEKMELRTGPGTGIRKSKTGLMRNGKERIWNVKFGEGKGEGGMRNAI